MGSCNSIPIHESVRDEIIEIEHNNSSQKLHIKKIVYIQL